jgi:prepilin-type N-terminal cleavage/methylation domain-containing protein
MNLYLKERHQSGFTLTELLIVVSIVVLLLLLLLINLRTQIKRANDSHRKADLNRIQKAFEEYVNDKRCYPGQDVLSVCEGTTLAPHLPRVPCDPVTRTPYLYVPGTDQCNGYRVCAKLEDKNDPDITRLGCHPDNGCGWGAGYNYCISIGYGVTPDGFNPDVAPTSTPTPTPAWNGPYACTPGGSCNYYGDPTDPIFPQYGCPVSWSGTCPAGACADPANRCDI